MSKVKQKYQQPIPILLRVRDIDFHISLSMDACIERIQKMSQANNNCSVDIEDSPQANFVPLVIRWGSNTPIHVECYITLFHAENSITQVIGKIGVVYPVVSYLFYFLVTWGLLAFRLIQSRGFSMDTVVTLCIMFGVMAVAVIMIFSIPIFTRPVKKRLESIHTVLKDDEKLKRATKNLDAKPKVEISESQVSEPASTRKRPNHMPR